MQFLHSRNPWSYSMDFDMMIDFCIWTLLVDGLHVPPFDQHLDGDGSLRAAGLTAKDWQSWLQHVMYQQDEQKQSLRRQAAKDHLNPPKFPEPVYPASIWSGSDAVRERLVELWTLYRPTSKREIAFGRALRKAEQKSGKRLFDELRPYHTRLPPLSIYLTEYEWPLDYLMSPAILLMTVQDGQPDPEEFRERVLAAAAQLVARPGQRGKQSSYTRVEEGSSQFNAVYRGYARKLVSPAPPHQEPPRLNDPSRQIVLERLGDEHSHYGIVDFSTLQFLREKQRPGWKLYEVTFQEIDGEQHRVIYILRQKEDGSWRTDSGGSTTDIPNQWSKFFAPVRDHPLILLSVSWMNHQQLLRTAHGHVIDNGFQVERVRLVNDAGQVLEDTVEDGFVFFACGPEQPVQLPMQAELYDHQGQLVWRQTVPDNGSPPWQTLRRRP